jgi:hypothetical protein
MVAWAGFYGMTRNLSKITLNLSFLPLSLKSGKPQHSGMRTHFLPKIHAASPTGRLSLVSQWKLISAVVAAKLAKPHPQKPPANEPSAPTDERLLTEREAQLLANCLSIPDSPLSKLAWDTAALHQPPWLQNHALRTYAWGSVLGELRGVAFNRDVLFAASALHDVGLTPAAAMPSNECFAWRGAQFARQTLADGGHLSSAPPVAEAIARHLDVRVDVVDGAEAHLLQAGAAVDVTGRGLTRIPCALHAPVIAKHPRLGMKAQLCACMRREAAAAPNTRVGIYERHANFTRLIESAPFEE